LDYSLAPVAHVDLLGATGDDGSPLVTLEAPDTNDLDIDPVESREGKLIARCALVRVRNDAHATVRNLIIDGRHQGWVLRRTGAEIEFKSVTTDNADTIIDHVETRNFDSTEAVRLGWSGKSFSGGRSYRVKPSTRRRRATRSSLPPRWDRHRGPPRPGVHCGRHGVAHPPQLAHRRPAYGDRHPRQRHRSGHFSRRTAHRGGPFRPGRRSAPLPRTLTLQGYSRRSRRKCGCAVFFA